MPGDPRIAAQVEQWQQRLASLAEEISEITAAAYVWARISAALDMPAANMVGDPHSAKPREPTGLSLAMAMGAAAPAALAGSMDGMSQHTVMVGRAAMSASRNIIVNAPQSKDHTTLVAAVKAAGLVQTLESTGPFTVFAPTNEAFAAVPRYRQHAAMTARMNCPMRETLNVRWAQ